MSQPPSVPSGYSQLRIPQPPAPRAAPQATHAPGVPTEHHVTAPTLLQFWRSDSRVVPGRARPKWAGRAAFWIGLLAAVLYFAGRYSRSLFLVDLAAPFAVVALAFALIAVIAGIGRGLGFFGLVFAVLGSHLSWVWLESTFG